MYLNKLQTFFGLNQFIDYTDKMVFHKKKKFFCLKSEKTIRCLGSGKGRNYSKIDEDSVKFLEEYYKEPNEKLKDLLLEFGHHLPEWLRDGNIRHGLEF